MINGKSVLAIIPARGGSKGLPNKNVKLFLGKPLIAWTIENALKSKYLDCILVSTDDRKIADISQQCGAGVIERPKELATDETPTTEVILNVLKMKNVERNSQDITIILQPTSPMRNTTDINNAIELFSYSNCESVVSVCELIHSPYWTFKLDKIYLKPLFDEKFLRMRRQELQTTYIPNGAIYILTPLMLHKHKTFYIDNIIPYIMPVDRSIDIDSEIDFILAELLEKKHETHK